MIRPINLNRFDLTSLRLFVATVDGGSLTAGAERFGISLAAASKRIAELESHVGTALLERSKRGVRPTAAGQTLLRHALDLVAGVEQLALAMDDFQRGAGGQLRLCANTSAFAGFLPPLLAAYTAAYPAVRIDLEDAISEDAVRAVARGSAELGVIGDNTAAEDLQTVLCDIDEMVLVMPVGHPLARRKAVPFLEALAFDIVGMDRSTSLMRQVGAGADAAGRSLKVRIVVRSYDAMCRMVSAGIGIGFLPRAGAAPHLRSMGLCAAELTGIRTERRLLLAMRDRSSLSPPAQAFVEMVERRLRGRD